MDINDVLNSPAFMVVDADKMPSADELRAAQKSAQVTLSELWYSNIIANQAFVSLNKTPSVESLYATLTPWMRLFRMFVPQQYYAARNIVQEIIRRRVIKTREKILICGIGNSFVNNILYVQEAMTRGWHVMCVDRARPQLVNASSGLLVPQYTVSIDGQPHCIKYLQDLKKGETVILEFQSHPTVVSHVHNSPARMLITTTFDTQGYNEILSNAFDNKYNRVIAHGIVMPTAIDIAIRMGYKTIALIGTELGWESQELVEPMYASSAYEVDGGGWWTIKPFEDAADGFKIIAKMVLLSDETIKIKGQRKRTLIDCSGGIDKGFTYMSISELLEKF